MGEIYFPGRFTLTFEEMQDLRYGENPHQRARIYTDTSTYSPLQHLTLLTGQGLGYVNATDIDAGIEAVRIHRKPTAAVIKHGSVCGIAQGASGAEASGSAILADPLSAFGGVYVPNFHVDLETAEVFGMFRRGYKSGMDVIACPSIDDDALARIIRAGRNTQVYTFGTIPKPSPVRYKSLDGALIVQTNDTQMLTNLTTEGWVVVTKAQPTPEQWDQMLLGWKYAARIRSNTVLIMDPELPMTRGIGSGQTSRIGSTEIALRQARKAGHVEGGVLVSDSFFPFGDCVRMATWKRYNVGAVLEQGGSNRDIESIRAADKAGIPMVFTGEPKHGMRAFWHG